MVKFTRKVRNGVIALHFVALLISLATVKSVENKDLANLLRFSCFVCAGALKLQDPLGCQQDPS